MTDDKEGVMTSDAAIELLRGLTGRGTLVMTQMDSVNRGLREDALECLERERELLILAVKSLTELRDMLETYRTTGSVVVSDNAMRRAETVLTKARVNE